MLPVLCFSSSNVQTAYTYTSHWSHACKVFLHCGFACVIWVAQITCTYSYIYGTRKVFLHCGFACVIWDTEPVCRKCYIGYKNKSQCVSLCFWRFKAWVEEYLHRSHEKGLSLRCVYSLCVLNFEARLEDASTDRMQKGFHHCGSSCVLRAWAVVEE